MTHKIYTMDETWWFAIYDMLIGGDYGFPLAAMNGNKKQVENFIHLNYGLKIVERGSYDYYIKDEKKFMLFMLRWGHVKPLSQT